MIPGQAPPEEAVEAEATDADEAAYTTYQQVTVDISAFADGDSHTVVGEQKTANIADKSAAE